MPLAIGLRYVDCIVENVRLSLRLQFLLQQEEMLLVRYCNVVKN